MPKTNNPMLKGGYPFPTRMPQAPSAGSGVSTPTRVPAPMQAPAPAPAPAPTKESIFNRAQAALGQPSFSAPEPTVGQSFSSPSYDQGPTLAQMQGEPVDERAVQRNQMQLFQGQIDATNQVYDTLLGEARLQGQGRLGSQRAMAARGGLLGSDFGASQKEAVQGHNNSIDQGIQAQRQAAVGSIMGQMREAVQNDIARKNQARKEGADSLIQYLASSGERKKSNTGIAANSFLMQGIDPRTLSPDELEAIATEAGVSSGDIIYQYQVLAQAQAAEQSESDLKTRKTEAEISKIEADIASGKLITLGEGTMLYDVETGETFKNPKTYAPKSGGLSGVPDNVVSTIRDRLEGSRRGDTYSDSSTYLGEYRKFVGAGGDPEGFLDTFSPDMYISPSDPDRGWLASQMKKTTLEMLSEADKLAQTFEELNQLRAQ